jgi:hypothetical protein
MIATTPTTHPTSRPHARAHTYLAPGQRYTPTGSATWRADKQVTILRVGRDLSGLLRVAYHLPNGHQVVEPAAQFEAAVANGQLVPVTGAGALARC